MPGKAYNTTGSAASRSARNPSPTSKTEIVTPKYGLPVFSFFTNLATRLIADRLVGNATEKQVVTTRVGGGSQTVVVGAKPTLNAGDAGERNRFEDLRPNQVQLPPGNPFEYNWNLPPHKWSLPTLPTTVNEKHFIDNKIPAKKQSTDRYRRGRIWWKANAPIATVDSNGNVTNLSVGDANRKYGFQFLWNPESFGTQVSVQLEAAPAVQDRWLGAAGAFPATETISFTVRIDRTNDFACAATSLKSLQNIVRTTGTTPGALFYSDVEDLKKFYAPAESFANAAKGIELNKKIVDLLQRGTIADIEYLYRAINGPGPGGSANATQWMNGRGIRTADIGWLMPTLLHVDIGPLAYDGYVTSLQVNHLAFTPSMVPIRSDITISLNLLATSSLTTATGGSQVPSSSTGSATNGFTPTGYIGRSFG